MLTVHLGPGTVAERGQSYRAVGVQCSCVPWMPMDAFQMCFFSMSGQDVPTIRQER